MQKYTQKWEMVVLHIDGVVPCKDTDVLSIYPETATAIAIFCHKVHKEDLVCGNCDHIMA